MAYIYTDSVAKDMQQVRRNLAEKNPAGVSVPLLVQVNEFETLLVDILPLYYCSEVARKQLEKLPKRSAGASRLVLSGTAPKKAFEIVVSYANGSANAQNWAADLDANLDLAAFVWEYAVVYKIENLEKFTRDAAFDEYTGALSEQTAVRLLKHSTHLPKYHMRALKYMCYHFGEVFNSRDFVFLTYPELKSIIYSKYLRANVEQVYVAISQWVTGSTVPEDKRKERQMLFYQLMKKFHYPLVPLDGKDPEDHYILKYREDFHPLAPRGPDDRRRRCAASFAAFRLRALLEEVSAYGTSLDMPLRFIGKFEAFKYYWQLECVWYNHASEASMGVYLGLIHGTDMAGSMVQYQDIRGLYVQFQLRIHCNDNFDFCFRQAKCVKVDMLNLPAGRSVYGYRSLLGKGACEKILKSMNDTRQGKRQKAIWDPYVSVEISLVQEVR